MDVYIQRGFQFSHPVQHELPRLLQRTHTKKHMDTNTQCSSQTALNISTQSRLSFFQNLCTYLKEKKKEPRESTKTTCVPDTNH